MAILGGINWRDVHSRIVSETKNREVHQPLVSLYRWWARRPHYLIGSIIDAAGATLSKRSLIVDPFSGGGTVAIESSQRGYRVYTQDVNPWAAWGLKVSLTPVDPDELEAACTALLATLRKSFGDQYRSTDGATVAHTFRVRRPHCAECQLHTWLFPYTLLTRASRSLLEPDAYFGCPGCGCVSRHSANAKYIRCSDCGRSLRTVVRAACAHCRAGFTPSKLRNAPWIPVLGQQVREVPDGRVIEFIPGTSAVATASLSLKLPPSLAAAIPLGLETNKLRSFGFTTWESLYPRRQLQVLLASAATIETFPVSENVRDRLQLAVAGAIEMPGHLCRWDRHHPKVFEALSNHRYSFDGLAVEPNPLSPVGRGSIARRLHASVVAARSWAKATNQNRTITYRRTDDTVAPPPQSDTVVVQGSSERLLLPDSSTKLVVTDPPYYDSVQYGELASLFLAWTAPFGIAARSGRLRISGEAVPNRLRRTGVVAYQAKLTSVFKECHRVLTSDGRLILTYHSSDLRAWWALATSLKEAGFRIISLAVAQTENATDHAKRGKQSFVHDLLLECAYGTEVGPVELLTKPRSAAERELLYVGCAMAALKSNDYVVFRKSFLGLSGRLRTHRIEAPLITVRTTKREHYGRRDKKSSSTPQGPRRVGESRHRAVNIRRSVSRQEKRPRDN